MDSQARTTAYRPDARPSPGLRDGRMLTIRRSPPVERDQPRRDDDCWAHCWSTPHEPNDPGSNPNDPGSKPNDPVAGMHLDTSIVGTLVGEDEMLPARFWSEARHADRSNGMQPDTAVEPLAA